MRRLEELEKDILRRLDNAKIMKNTDLEEILYLALEKVAEKQEFMDYGEAKR